MSMASKNDTLSGRRIEDISRRDAGTQGGLSECEAQTGQRMTKKKPTSWGPWFVGGNAVSSASGEGFTSLGHKRIL